MPKSFLIQQQHNKNANKISSLDFIYQEIAKRMADRLDYIKLNPNMILDIGSGLGIDAKLLQQHFPKTHVIQLDAAINVLKDTYPAKSLLQKLFGKQDLFVCADALNLPINNQVIDIVWSNLCLPYVEDLNNYFKEIRRVLKVGGYFLVSGLGVDSLQQLRDVGLRTFNFPDMHIIGDILVKLGFTNPVTDLEYVNLEYDNFKQLLADIRIIGCGSVITMPTKFNHQDYLELESRFAKLTKNGKNPLTLEIFYAHAWKDSVRLDLPEDKKGIQFYPQKP